MHCHMNEKARLIIMSHLSDAQESLNKNAVMSINFAKFLLMKYPNTDVEIDPDAEWAEFAKKHPGLASVKPSVKPVQKSNPAKQKFETINKKFLEEHKDEIDWDYLSDVESDLTSEEVEEFVIVSKWPRNPEGHPTTVVEDIMDYGTNEMSLPQQVKFINWMLAKGKLEKQKLLIVEIKPGDTVEVGGHTTAKFLGFSTSGCDALFDTPGVGYHSTIPNAKEWLNNNCKKV